VSGHATIYAARSLSLAVVRSAARGLRIQPGTGECLAVLETQGLRIIVNQLTPAQRDEHLVAIRGYITSQCHVADETFLAEIEDTAQVLGLIVEPELDPQGKAAELVLSLARYSGGFSFDGQVFRDGDGRLVAQPLRGDLGAGNEDSITSEVSHDDRGKFTEPPDAARVMRRAWIFAAVTMRAFLEDEPAGSADEAQSLIWSWLETFAATADLEEAEEAMLATPHGSLTLDQRDQVRHRGEALAVLTWALGVGEMPDHETPTDPGVLAGKMGFLGAALHPALKNPRLRSAPEIDWTARRILGIHWRLREFWLRPKAVDFRTFARTAWFGAFDLVNIRLFDDDLAIGGKPITLAPREQIKRCHDMAVERHQAIAWLRGMHRDYSKVDTST
jgi:hypothetical protein